MKDKLTEMMKDGKSTWSDLWKQAPNTITDLNEDIDSDTDNPKISFDCGFKLDFDGSLITVSSRFYKPNHFGTNPNDKTWSGFSRIYFLDKQVFEKEFICNDLSELRTEVILYIEQIKQKFSSIEW